MNAVYISGILNIFPRHFFATEQQIVGDAVHKPALLVANVLFYLSFHSILLISLSFPF